MLRTSGLFEVWQCERCAAGLTLPPASPSELASFYGGSYAPYEVVRGRFQQAISSLVQRVQAWRGLARAPLAALPERSGGRALDVGCGRGDLGAWLIARGWQVTGIDPSEAACEAARKRGVDARAGTLGEVRLERGHYDAAIFHHSLEHVPDPAEALHHTHAALKDGGLLLVSVPNFGCWQRRRFGSRWFHLDLPRHRVHFNPRALSWVLERRGFEVAAISTSTSAIGLPASIQYALVGHCLFPSGLGQRIATAACLPFLPLARLLDALGGDGDSLHAVARKPRVAAALSAQSTPTASSAREKASAARS